MNVRFTEAEQRILRDMAMTELRDAEGQARWCVKVYDELRRLPLWRSALLDERMRREIDFCAEYKRNFNHGAPSHSHMLLIAILAEELDRLHGLIQSRKTP